MLTVEFHMILRVHFFYLNMISLRLNLTMIHRLPNSELGKALLQKGKLLLPLRTVKEISLSEIKIILLLEDRSFYFDLELLTAHSLP